MTSVNTSIATLRKAASEEAARLVRLAAEPLTTRDTVNRCIQQAATRLGWSYTRVEDVWRKEARRIESWEMDQLRALPQQRRAGVAVGALDAMRR